MRHSALMLAAVVSVGLAPHGWAQDAKAPPPAAAPDTLQDARDQVSYAIGLNLGLGLKRDAVAVDPQILAQGVRDAQSGSKPRLTDDQVHAALARLQAAVEARRQEIAGQAAATNKAEGAAFLAANAAKAGVVSLPSGLQYQVLTAGSGPTPKLDDTVVCNYRGTLLNGAEFDSSYKRGSPASFPVNGVIKGWTEALRRMPVGSKWRLFVPADLAYGEKGVGGDIGPNAVLIFEVELLSIQAGG